MKRNDLYFKELAQAQNGIAAQSEILDTSFLFKKNPAKLDHIFYSYGFVFSIRLFYF